MTYLRVHLIAKWCKNIQRSLFIRFQLEEYPELSKVDLCLSNTNCKRSEFTFTHLSTPLQTAETSSDIPFAQKGHSTGPGANKNFQLAPHTMLKIIAAVIFTLLFFFCCPGVLPRCLHYSSVAYLHVPGLGVGTVDDRVEILENGVDGGDSSSLRKTSLQSTSRPLIRARA